MQFFRERRSLPKNLVGIFFDFDGVFTNNKVTVDEEGKESVNCNRADGLGVRMLKEMNIPLFILSTETNQVAAKRAKKLALEIYYGIEDKKDVLISLCRKNRFELRNVMFVGNDLNDLEVMKIVGHPAAPRDAHPVIRRIAKYIIAKNGGDGVVKEIAERLNKR